MMERYPAELLARMAIGDNHPAVDPDPAGRRRKQVPVAVGAEPSLEFCGDRHEVLHGDLTCELNVAVRKHKLPFACVALSQSEQIGDPFRRNHLLHPFFLRSSPGHRRSTNQFFVIKHLCKKMFDEPIIDQRSVSSRKAISSNISRKNI